MKLICNSKTICECTICVHSIPHVENDMCHSRCPDDILCKCIPEVKISRKQKLKKLNEQISNM